MPETYREFVNRMLRDHEGGDPATYPVGDRSTARKPIDKRDLRAVLLAQEDKVEEAQGAAAQAIAAAEAAAQALSDVQGATFFAANLTTLLANTDSFAAGTVFATREEGFSYKVVTSNPHFTTAGGVMLEVVPRNGVVTPSMFGASADGGIYTGQIAAMIEFGASSGAIIDGEGKTYKVDQTLSLTPHRARWRNIGIDGAGIITNGLFSTPVCEMICADYVAVGSATSTVYEYASTATLSSVSGLIAGDWVLLTSQKAMAETEVEGQATRHSRACELLRVKSISGNTVTFWSRPQDRYHFADSPVIYKVQTEAGVDFENVTFIGADCGFFISDGFESRYRGCSFINQTTRGLNEDRCYRTDGDDFTFRSEATEPAFTQAPYGLCYVACQNCHYGDVTGDRTRHLTTTGSNSNSRGRYVSRGCTLGDIYCTNSFSSVVDQHPGGGYIQVGNVYAEFAENASHFIACQFEGGGGSVKSIDSNGGTGIDFGSFGYASYGFTPTVSVETLRCINSAGAVVVTNYSNRYGTGKPQKIAVHIGFISSRSGEGMRLTPHSEGIEVVVNGGQMTATADLGPGRGIYATSGPGTTAIRVSNTYLQTTEGGQIISMTGGSISWLAGRLNGSSMSTTLNLNGTTMQIIGAIEQGFTTTLSNGGAILRASMT